MKDVHIIVLSGQSNACGVAHHKYLKENINKDRREKLFKGFDNVLIKMWSHGYIVDHFIPVKLSDSYQGGDVPGTYGPEIGIAESISSFIKDKIYIAKYAYGGASLDYDFCPKTSTQKYDKCSIHGDHIGWAFEGLIDFVKSILDDFNNKGLNPIIAAFMWMQGESDSIHGPLERYKEKFDCLIKEFKSEFKNNINKDFMIIDAGVSETSVWELPKEINEIKNINSKKIKNYIYLDTNKEGLTTTLEPYEAPDVYHYDSLAMLKLGNMFGEAYLKVSK